jgi:hypothetical protein
MNMNCVRSFLSGNADFARNKSALALEISCRVSAYQPEFQSTRSYILGIHHSRLQYTFNNTGCRLCNCSTCSENGIPQDPLACCERCWCQTCILGQRQIAHKISTATRIKSVWLWPRIPSNALIALFAMSQTTLA